MTWLWIALALLLAIVALWVVGMCRAAAMVAPKPAGMDDDDQEPPS